MLPTSLIGQATIRVNSVIIGRLEIRLMMKKPPSTQVGQFVNCAKTQSDYRRLATLESHELTGAVIH